MSTVTPSPISPAHASIRCERVRPAIDVASVVVYGASIDLQLELCRVGGQQLLDLRAHAARDDARAPAQAGSLQGAVEGAPPGRRDPSAITSAVTCPTVV